MLAAHVRVLVLEGRERFRYDGELAGRLRLLHLCCGQFLLHRHKCLHLNCPARFELRHQLGLCFELLLAASQQLRKFFLLFADIILDGPALHQVPLMLLQLELEVHLDSLRLLHLRLQLRDQRLLIGALVLELRDELLHAVDLGVELLKLVVLRLDFFGTLSGAFLGRLRLLLGTLEPVKYTHGSDERSSSQ